MIEIMNGSAGNVVGMRALFCMDPDFRGWKLSAAWENTKLDFRFRGTLDATWATRTVNARIVPLAAGHERPQKSNLFRVAMPRASYGCVSTSKPRLRTECRVRESDSWV